MIIDTLGTIGGVATVIGLLCLIAAAACMIYDFDITPKLLFGGIAAFGIGLVMSAPVAVQQEREKRDTFMADCMKDRKQYECTAMWRGK